MTAKVGAREILAIDGVIAQTMLHLPPRQVYRKLMLVSKWVYVEVKRNRYYFQRAAAHVAYMFYVDLSPDMDKYILMKNLELGYHRSMEHFMELIRAFLWKHFGIEAASPRQMYLNLNKAANKQRESCVSGNMEGMFFIVPRLITPLPFKLTSTRILRDHAECMRMRYRHSVEPSPVVENWNALLRKAKRLSDDLEDDGRMTVAQKRGVATWMYRRLVFKNSLFHMLQMVSVSVILEGSDFYDSLEQRMLDFSDFLDETVPEPSREWVWESAQDIVWPGFEEDLEEFSGRFEYVKRLGAALGCLKPNLDSLWPPAKKLCKVQDAPESAFRVDARTGNKILPASAFGGTQDIRVAVNAKGRYMVDIVGVIEATTGKNRNEAGEVWRKMDKDIKKKVLEDLAAGEEMGTFNELRGTHIQANNSVEVCSFTKGLLMLLIQLKNDIAKGLLTKMVEVMSRYIAGDYSLVDELAENEVSSLPLHRAFREAWQAEGGLQTNALSNGVLALTKQLPLLTSAVHMMDSLRAGWELEREAYNKAHERRVETLEKQLALVRHDLEDRRDEYQEQVEFLRTDYKHHLAVVRTGCEDRLKDCRTDVEQIKRDYGKQMELIQSEWERELTGVRADHQRELAELRAEHKRQLKTAVQDAVERNREQMLGRPCLLNVIVREVNPAWVFDLEEIKKIGSFVISFMKKETGFDPKYALHEYSEGREMVSRGYYERDKLLVKAAVEKYFAKKRRQVAGGVRVSRH